MEKEVRSIAIRNLAKVLSTGSVQVMLGGVASAVMPPQIGLLFKGIVYVGGAVLALSLAKPVENLVDETFDEIESEIKEAKSYVEVLKSKEFETEIEKS